MGRGVLAALLILVLLAPAGAFAQDSHYWTQQYGDRADLLGGVVVGSVVDLSAVYYNPGALVLADEATLFLTTFKYELNRLSRSDVGPGERDLSSTRVGPAPSFVAGELPVHWLGESRWAYSFFTRQDFDARVSAGGQESASPGILLNGDLLFDQNLTESWGGLSWSYPLGERMGVGVSLFGAYRSQRTRDQNILLGSEGNEALSLINLSEVSFYHFRMLAKAGFTVRRDQLAFGLTVTTPSLGILGSGSLLWTRSLVADTDPDTGNLLASTAQDDLKTDYHSPVSLAGGLSYGLGATRFFVSAEWFNAIRTYQVLGTQPFEVQTSSDTLTVPVTQALTAVLNAGLGGEFRVSPVVALYGSFTTDFSAASPSPGSITLATWDLYHLGVGTSLNFSSADLTLGLGYAFGSDDLQPSTIVGDPAAGGSIRYQRLKALLGFSFTF
jgi:hypothetical protein